MDDLQVAICYEGEMAAPTQAVLDAGAVAAAFAADSARLLGRGSFGETWLVDTAGQGSRAAKVILSNGYPQARLEREVEGLRRVDSAHVVKLLSTATVELGGTTRPALVFEFVDGGDLGSRVQLGVRVPPEDVAVLGVGLLDGLKALHAADTVHRDVKPANVALRGGSWSAPVLLDLGLARVLDQATLTTYPQLLGTLAFMAPEQLRGEPARKAADVFSAGVVMHLLLAGQHPFYGPRSEQVDRPGGLALIEAGPKPLPDDVPADLAVTVRRLLASRPHERGSAARAVRDLSYGGLR